MPARRCGSPLPRRRRSAGAGEGRLGLPVLLVDFVGVGERGPGAGLKVEDERRRVLFRPQVLGRLDRVVGEPPHPLGLGVAELEAALQQGLHQRRTVQPPDLPGGEAVVALGVARSSSGCAPASPRPSAGGPPAAGPPAAARCRADLRPGSPGPPLRGLIEEPVRSMLDEPAATGPATAHEMPDHPLLIGHIETGVEEPPDLLLAQMAHCSRTSLTIAIIAYLVGRRSLHIRSTCSD